MASSESSSPSPKPKVSNMYPLAGGAISRMSKFSDTGLSRKPSMADIVVEAVQTWPTPTEMLTNLPGFSDISIIKQVLPKIFWILFTLGALAVTTFQIYEVVNDYRKSPTKSSVTERSSYMTPVPNVIICPLSSVNYTYLDQKGLSKDYARLLLSSQASTFIPGAVSDILNMSPDRIQKASEEYDAYTRQTGYSLEKQLLDMGPTCEKVFKRCWMSWVSYSCCDKVTAVMTELGKCFVKTPIAGIRAISGPGRSYHITLDLTGLVKAKDIETVGNDNFTYLDSGATATFLNERKVYNIRESLAFVQPGVNGLVGLSRTFIESKPGSGCAKSSSLAYYEQYNRFDCEEECTFNITLKYCGCGTTGTSQMNIDLVKSKLCTPLQTATCIIPKMFSQSKDKELILDLEACKRDCKPQCAYWSYKISYMYNTLVPDTTYPVNATDMVLLTLYNMAKVWTSSQEVNSLTWSGMIGSLGGILGLWLGIQIASLVQIAFYSVVKLAQCCSRNGARKQRFNGSGLPIAPSRVESF